MKKLGEAFKWFCYITTAILIVVAVNFIMAGEETIPADTLWKMILAGFLTAIITLFLHPEENNTKGEGLLKVFMHYAVLCVIMIACGCWFGWIAFDLSGILLMLISVAVVYAIVFGVHWIVDIRQADEINRRLKEKYKDE